MANFTDDERALLASVPQLIGSAVASAAGSGIFGTGKELFASANAMLDAVKSYPANAVIRELLPDPAADRAAATAQMKKTRDWAMKRIKDKGIDNAEKLRALVIEDTKAAAALVAAKATPAEAGEYRQWAIAVAEKVANAATEGGFLGFGGVRVSAAETALIEDIKKALG